MKILSFLSKLILTAIITVTGIFSIGWAWRIPMSLITSHINEISAYLSGVGVYLIVIGVIVSAIYSWMVIHRIDSNHLLSVEIKTFVNKIKWSFAAITLGVYAWLPAVYQLADRKDAPGIILIVAGLGILPMFTGIILGLVEGVMKRRIV